MEAASASSIGPQLIEVCKRSPNELAKIRQLVKSCPDAVRYRDHEDRTALHVLCANRPPLPSVQFLLQAQGQGQQACSLRTNKGMLPLHYACREQASAEVVELYFHNIQKEREFLRPAAGGPYICPVPEVELRRSWNY